MTRVSATAALGNPAAKGKRRSCGVWALQPQHSNMHLEPSKGCGQSLGEEAANASPKDGLRLLGLDREEEGAQAPVGPG